MRNLTLEETLALGTAIARLAAASIWVKTHPRCGADLDAIEETEELIRAIELRLGSGAGSRAAYELRAAMAALMTAEATASAEEDAREAVLAG
jgi:hypothetical protein